MKISIIPPPFNVSATQLEIIDPVWQPNVGINFEYRFLNADNEICSTRKRIMFDGEDYANWGAGDDVAVIHAIAAKLGVEVAPEQA